MCSVRCGVVLWLTSAAILVRKIEQCCLKITMAFISLPHTDFIMFSLFLMCTGNNKLLMNPFLLLSFSHWSFHLSNYSLQIPDLYRVKLLITETRQNTINTEYRRSCNNNSVPKGVN